MLAARRGGTSRGAPVPGHVRLTVLSGPSGVGKTTVAAQVRQQCPDVWLSVSVTTRPPRASERDGREYHFVSEGEFDEMAARGELLEQATSPSGSGYRYGTPRMPVLEHLDRGIPALLEIDVAGARQVRAAVPDALLVFLAPPSWAELERRLVGRNTESPEVIARRLTVARSELDAGAEFDITLVNASVQDVCAQLIALMTAQHRFMEGTSWQPLRP